MLIFFKWLSNNNYIYSRMCCTKYETIKEIIMSNKKDDVLCEVDNVAGDFE